MQEVEQKLKDEKEKENAKSAPQRQAGGDEGEQSPKSGSNRSGAPVGEANSTTPLDQQQPVPAEQPAKGKAEGAESADPSAGGKADARGSEQTDQGKTSTPGEQDFASEKTATQDGQRLPGLGDDAHPAKDAEETVRGLDPTLDPFLENSDGGDDSFIARHAHGGNFLPHAPRWVNPENMRRAARALKRLIDQDNDGLDTSPRLDGRALATELISQRLNPSKRDAIGR